MSSLLEKSQLLDGQKLVVVGDVGVDEYVNGMVKRISPEAPVPIVEVAKEESRLGLATNVAQNIAALGGTCFLVSVVGEDSSADRLRSLLKDVGVSADSLVVDSSRPTTRKLRVMSEHHHLVRVDFEKRQFITNAVEDQILNQVKTLLPDCDGIIIQDYAKGVITQSLVQNLISEAHACHKKVMVDPNKATPLEYFKGADLMTPNLDEAIALSRLPIDDLRLASDTLAEVGEALMAGVNSQNLVITRGRDGMSLFEGKHVERVPTFARDVYDVTGAGDTVIATLAMAWSAGLTLKDACLLANHAAGVVVGKIGCVPCQKEELLASIRKHS